MKKHFYLFPLFAATAMILFGGCEKEKNEDTHQDPELIPEIIFANDSVLTLPAEGGTADFLVEVRNPYEGGELSAVAQGDWISEVVCVDGSVSFIAAANTEEVERNAEIKVVYRYDGAKTVERAMSIVQEAAAAEPPAKEYDVDIAAVYADALYQSDSEGLMDARMVFTDMEVVGDKVAPPGAMLYVEALFTLNEEGRLDIGDYSVALENAPYTVFPGQVVDYAGTNVTMGTYLALFDEGGMRTEHLVLDGTMIIGGDAQSYNIECRFTTEDGLSVRCIWNGPLAVRDVPGPFSTLTDDYTLDLSNAVCSAKYFADLYGTGGANWFIELKPADGVAGDAVNMDIVCEDLSFISGITAGTYHASLNSTPLPGEYLTGSMSYNSLLGTVYMGDYVDGYPESYAPATSGDLEIVRNQDGGYTFNFVFQDDKGNVWDGTWTGPVDMVNMRP